jgi:hypothetical protein
MFRERDYWRERLCGIGLRHRIVARSSTQSGSRRVSAPAPTGEKASSARVRQKSLKMLERHQASIIYFYTNNINVI